MNEETTKEPLLANPPPQELLPSGETTPLLTAEQFIKTTPLHELKNVFGHTSEEIPASTLIPPLTPKSEETSQEFKNLQKDFLSVSKKETAKPAPAPLPVQKVGFWKRVFRIFAAVFLVLLIIMLALYIWGGLLQK